MKDLEIPKHIGYVVDGNRRWAKEHGLPYYEGHMAGYNAIKDIVRATVDAGVKYVSTYIFSTENWKRSEDEVGRLMKLILKILTDDLDDFKRQEVRVVVLGSRDRLSDKVLKAIERAQEETKGFKRATLAICLNYGGQMEIADAVKKIVQSGVKLEEVNVDLVAKNLYAPDVPPLDVMVRTSGEKRISNFMLWRSAYAELIFLDKPWPDMTKRDVAAILREYSKRQRRFGG